MSHIHIRKKHTLGKQRARKTAEQIAGKLASEYNATCRWKKDNLEFSSSGVNGCLHVSGDEVEIQVDLGLMLRPFRAKIENGIIAQLDEILGGDEISA
ncbi:MAG: polyhydroxyalkanoic acid system family protein [Gammaproteobacteria bacterium]